MIIRKKKESNFQIAKVAPQGTAQFLLIFCQFQPGVAYKGVAYKKRVAHKEQCDKFLKLTQYLNGTA